MFLSLVLLAVFLAFWLRSAWDEQQRFLQKEADNLFRRAVLDLQDSMVQRSLVRENLGADSLLKSPLSDGAWLPKVIENQAFAHELVDFVGEDTGKKPPLKPGQVRMNFQTETQAIVAVRAEENAAAAASARPRETERKVQILISSDDPAEQFEHPADAGLDRVLLHVRDAGQRGGKFVFKLHEAAPDSLEMARRYRQLLDAAGIGLSFQIAPADSTATPPPAAAMATAPALVGILSKQAFRAYVFDYQWFVLRKIAPHLLFSLFLFGITAAAFGAVNTTLRQQQRLAEHKNDFIANITHELKTPITTVGVALEALSDFDVLQSPERAREYLGISKLELERLALLVDKVLRLSQFEQRVPQLRMEPLDMAALVAQVLDAMKLQLAQAEAKVHFAPVADENFTLAGDRVHLAGVVFNLVDNALKYRRDAPEIAIFLQKTPENALHLTVRDNGIGIAEEHMGKIFEKFYRVPMGNTHNVKGHGLGLNYVAAVVEQHGGRVRAESQPGAGSAFIVDLPLPTD